jgi:hypothetical protein
MLTGMGPTLMLLLCAILQVTKVYWDFRKGLIPIIGGSRLSTNWFHCRHT